MNKGDKKLSGTGGTAFINAEELADLEKIKATVSGKFEEFNQCNDPATHQSYQGWAGEGSVSFIKENSRGIELLAEAYRTGKMPDVKIITVLRNLSTGKSERVAIEEIVFTEFDLANFEAKGLVKEELPFKFASYTVLQTL